MDKFIQTLCAFVSVFSIFLLPPWIGEWNEDTIYLFFLSTEHKEFFISEQMSHLLIIITPPLSSQ